MVVSFCFLTFQQDNQHVKPSTNAAMEPILPVVLLALLKILAVMQIVNVMELAKAGVTVVWTMKRFVCVSTITIVQLNLIFKLPPMDPKPLKKHAHKTKLVTK